MSNLPATIVRRRDRKLTAQVRRDILVALRCGVTLQLAAQVVAGCSARAIRYARDKYPTWSEQLDEAVAEACGLVEHNLFKNATVYCGPTMPHGNVTAQHIYLKNRDPNRWRETIHHHHQGAVAVAEWIRISCEVPQGAQ